MATGSKAQVYVQGGLNLANITKTNDGHTEKNNILPSFNVGIFGRFGLSSTVDLETGILFTGHGSKAETYFNGGNDFVKSKFSPYYFQVPLNAVIKILNNPRLKRLNGKEIIDKIGLIILKPIASKIPPTINVFSPPCRISPSKSIWVIYSANE